MRLKSQSWRLWGSALGLAGALVAGDAALAATDTIVVARPADADSMDTHRVSTTISLQAMTQVYGNMVHMDADANIVGGLAESVFRQRGRLDLHLQHAAGWRDVPRRDGVRRGGRQVELRPRDRPRRCEPQRVLLRRGDGNADRGRQPDRRACGALQRTAGVPLRPARAFHVPVDHPGRRCESGGHGTLEVRELGPQQRDRLSNATRITSTSIR